MEHASKRTWLVACTDEPKLPPASPGLEVEVLRQGNELFDLCAELAGNAPRVVVRITAWTAGDEHRLCALSLTQATRGVLLFDMPAVCSLRVAGEVVPPLEQAWAALAAAAAEGARLLSAEKAEWKPDPKDDWGDL